MLFGKRKYKQRELLQWQESLANKILNNYRGVQTRWVKIMERMVSKFSLRTQKIGFIFLLTSGMVYCGHIVYSGIKKRSKSTISIDAINTGKHVGQTGEEQLIKTHANRVDSAYQQILFFQKYLDSLQLSPSGRKTYDSIVQYHPGLLDSLSILKNMYQRKQ